MASSVAEKGISTEPKLIFINTESTRAINKIINETLYLDVLSNLV